MAAKKPPATDAFTAALFVVCACIRAEAQAQRSTVPTDPQRASRVRLSLALDSIATRIEASVPAGTP